MWWWEGRTYAMSSPQSNSKSPRPAVRAINVISALNQRHQGKDINPILIPTEQDSQWYAIAGSISAPPLSASSGSGCFLWAGCVFSTISGPVR